MCTSPPQLVDLCAKLLAKKDTFVIFSLHGRETLKSSCHHANNGRLRKTVPAVAHLIKTFFNALGCQVTGASERDHHHVWLNDNIWLNDSQTEYLEFATKNTNFCNF